VIVVAQRFFNYIPLCSSPNGKLLTASPGLATPLTAAMALQDEHAGFAEGLGVDDTVENFDDFDEFVEFGDSLTIGDEGYQKPDWNFQNTPPYDEDLPSTTLPWEPPKQENPRPIYPAPINTLSFAQQEKLRSIAMPGHLQYRDQYSPKSASSTRTYKSSSATSPEGQANSRKRKSSAEADDEDEDDDEEDNREGQGPLVKKTAHNTIEKRYRTNLNDKIATLRDSVPSLRATRKPGKGGNTVEIKEDLQGLTPAHKLNKVFLI
jgi:Helix-loop-helix DNA-binding domain